MTFSQGFLAAVFLACSGAASAEAYFPIGNPGACGDYDEAFYTPTSWFPGGAGSAMRLDNPTQIRGLDGVLYDVTVVEEGVNEPAGRFLFLRSRMEGRAVLLVTSSEGTAAYGKC